MSLPKKGEGLSLLLKLLRGFLTEDPKEASEETEKPEALSDASTEAEPMKAYWEKDQQALSKRNQPFIDLFLKGGLERIPDVTEKPVKESHYKFNHLNYIHLPDSLRNLNYDVQDTPKPGTGISSSGRDASVVAGIVVAVITGILILAALITVVVYKHYVNRNVTLMNFDNPVYRKTTEDQFALEKNGYAPGSKLYPSTVGEEAQEPLNTPGTNEFV